LGLLAEAIGRWARLKFCYICVKFGPFMWQIWCLWSTNSRHDIDIATMVVSVAW